MIYAEAPDKVEHTLPAVFLAGGITGCPDWQTWFAANVSTLPIVLVNPRRLDFVPSSENEKVQVEWEHQQLRLSNVIVFWFPKESICPIALLELGKYLAAFQMLIIGIEPGYKYEENLRHQIRLERPKQVVFSDLRDVAQRLIEEFQPWR